MGSDGMPDTTWGTHCDMRNVSRITGLDWTVILVSRTDCSHWAPCNNV